MEDEAIELGADGVVGVRLDVNYYEWGADSAEFIAMGTAIKAEDGKLLSQRRVNPSPRTSPARSSGRCGRSATSRWASSWAPASTTSPTVESARRCAAGQNTELPNYTQALYDARELAMTRMQDEANRLGATGIVGVRLDEKSHMWGATRSSSSPWAPRWPRRRATRPSPPRTIISLDG